MAGDIFVVSDTHFGHNNIIKYCNRPFDSVRDMNEAMISNWNGVVGENDTVIHTGDFAFLPHNESKEICSRLNGIKILTTGNHDHSTSKMMDMGFNLAVSKLEMRVGHNNYLFQHYPIDDPHILGDRILIHGHRHNSIPLRPNKNSFNVSVENINYTPIRLLELIK